MTGPGSLHQTIVEDQVTHPRLAPSLHNVNGLRILSYSPILSKGQSSQEINNVHWRLGTKIYCIQIMIVRA